MRDGEIVAAAQEERRVAPTDSQPQLWASIQLNVARSDLPAITHVDYSARIQTVCRETNPNYYDLLKTFERLTLLRCAREHLVQCAGRTIVCTATDAYRCFMRTHIDFLVLGPFLLDKRSQPAYDATKDQWERQFTLD